ncbi:MAG: hypothetical protein LBD99_04830 [Candidatus Margulisbacteria bacterium]|jgi:hypothetical protein|nr:hypothetical protein [Candidatus Margulisiibacteriota bacterium]
MAVDYSGSYNGIASGGEITAANMTAALNLLEKVAHKTADLASRPSSEDAYPTAKAVYDQADGKRLESTRNKVQSIHAASDDTVYSSTQALYGALVELRGWLNCGGAI